jgi:hypothetical protein
MHVSLRKALSAIEHQGTFAVRRQLTAGALRLEVAGVGPLSFPVSPTKARQLCASALLARHGHRDRTVLDRRVRDSWEIPKSRLKIDQRRFVAALAPELERIRDGLGLPKDSRLRAELHNLLVYAPGQFFVPHQDSEKSDGMIGTLIVTLPSRFSGGTLIIKHHDEKVEFRGAGNKLELIAFYADCHHEVRPVSSGYRIVLTYNLLLSKGRAAQDIDLPAPILADIEARVREFFVTPPPPLWTGAKSVPPPDRLVYLLDHQYSQSGLASEQLKGTDAPRARALRDAAKRLDCDVALALADVHETWSCVDESYGFRDSRRRSRSYYGDEGEADDGSDGDAATPELIELENSEVEMRYVAGPAGAADIASGHVSDAELCFTKPSVDLDPFRSEHEPYMGNWGNTVDRWYHRAAIVLWPRERSFVLRAKASAKFALDELLRAVSAEGLESARKKAMQVEPHWLGAWHQANDARLVPKVFEVALALASPELAASLLRALSLEHLSSRVVPSVVALLERYGSTWFRELLQHWENGARSRFDEKRIPWLSSFHELIRALSSSGSPQAHEISVVLAESQWSWLMELRRAALEGPSSSRLTALAKLEQPMLRVLESAALLGRDDRHTAMQRVFTEAEQPVLALAHLLATARNIHGSVAAAGLESLETHCVAELRRHLALPARSKDDWSISLPLRCACELCRELGRFLTARTKTELEWPLAKYRRAHIHGIIDGCELPVTHTTRRVGSPYTLVLEKTRALFERESEERGAWQSALELIGSGAGKGGRKAPRSPGARRAEPPRARGRASKRSPRAGG